LPVPEVLVENLEKSFGATKALAGVSFNVVDGEFFTLLGPSGCGKSTTLMSIAGLQEPDRGIIRCGGQTFFDGDSGVYMPAERRNLGIVFQSYATWPHMTVFDNVAYPLRVRRMGKGDRRRLVGEVLELVELAPLAGRYPHELSGGQQQRVALARALVYSPSVLLLDEPFSNLDAKLRERARTWLKELQRELRITTLFVTHDQNEALALSDRVLVMRDGNVLQVGTPVEVYRRPADRFVAEFVGRCNFLEATVSQASGGIASVALAGAGGRLEVAAGDGPGPAPGSKVTVAVRPEALKLLSNGAPSGNENVLEVEVRSVAFLGDHYEYHLSSGQIDLTAVAPELIPTEYVRIQIPPEACSLIADFVQPPTTTEAVPT
jgi:iron(III) transport system ATP-binding protein